MAEAETPVAPEKPEPVRVYRHRLPARIWHWFERRYLARPV